MAALTDFHKAQCFFMLATNTAALVVIRNGGLDCQSLQQIYNNWIFLKVIVISGFLPITFTLANLFLVGMLSWYIILITSLTVALSIATNAAVGKFNPSDSEMKDLANIATSGGPTECGGHNPGVYCFDPIEYDSTGQGSSGVSGDAHSMLAFCLLVMVLLVGLRLKFQDLAPVRTIRLKTSNLGLTLARGLWGFLQHLGRHPTTKLLYTKLGEATQTCWKRTLQRFCPSSETPKPAPVELWLRAQIARIKSTKANRVLAERFVDIVRAIQEQLQILGWEGSARLFLKTVFYALFIYLYFKFFTIFLRDLAWFAQMDVYSRKWNFGQVVAITVWAPPICEFIHLEIRE